MTPERLAQIKDMLTDDPEADRAIQDLLAEIVTLKTGLTIALDRWARLVCDIERDTGLQWSEGAAIRDMRAKYGVGSGGRR